MGASRSCNKVQDLWDGAQERRAGVLVSKKNDVRPREQLPHGVLGLGFKPRDVLNPTGGATLPSPRGAAHPVLFDVIGEPIKRLADQIDR